MIVLLVLEIAVTLMRLTGLNSEKSRFQVVSLLTATGFTTKESELILRHPVRRKIAVFLILFGVFSLAVMISSISGLLAKHSHIGQLLIAAAILSIGLAIVRNRRFRSAMSGRLEGIMEETFELHELPIQEVLFEKDDDRLIDIPILDHSGFVDRTWAESIDSSQDMVLLFIQRGECRIRKERLETKLEAGDVLFVFGSGTEIGKVFPSELREREAREKDEKQAEAML